MLDEKHIPPTGPRKYGCCMQGVVYSDKGEAAGGMCITEVGM